MCKALILSGVRGVPGRFKGDRESRGPKGGNRNPPWPFGPSGAEENKTGHGLVANRLSGQAHQSNRLGAPNRLSGQALYHRLGAPNTLPAQALRHRRLGAPLTLTVQISPFVV